MSFCIACGGQVPAEANACPACGRATTTGTPATPPEAASSAPAAVVGLTDNVAGALAYVTIIPAIVFLVMEPYNRNRFIRFHSFQCIFAAVAWTALWIALGIVVHIPFFGWLTFLVWPLVSLAGFVVWLILVLKAYQGQKFKLPVIGDIAEKQASA
jgi:uncharacterized membrane protein